MKKKAILLLLLLTGLIPLACCPENPSGPYLLQLRHASLRHEGFLSRNSVHADTFLAPEEVYTEDTLVLSLSFDYLLAQQQTAFSLQPTALALSCDEYPDLKALHDKITAITITSNAPYNGVAAGEPLDAAGIAFFGPDESLIPLAQAISDINGISGNDFFTTSSQSLVLSNKPQEEAERTFKVTVQYASGKKETAETTRLTWK
ncbi:hypothetical protein ACXYMU_13200 [Pontibacter sp. CAU 1760]